MKRPALDDIAMAAEWLSYNTGDDGEAAACKHVAAWLDYIVSDDVVRKQARAHRVPVKALRAKLRSHHTVRP